MTGDDILSREIIKFVHKTASTKSMVMGFFAKGAGKLAKPPQWMTEPHFDGVRWVDIPIHERKYQVRKLLARMLEQGYLRREVYKSFTYGTQARLFPGTVLDRLAAIE